MGVGLHRALSGNPKCEAQLLLHNPFDLGQIHLQIYILLDQLLNFCCFLNGNGVRQQVIHGLLYGLLYLESIFLH